MKLETATHICKLSCQIEVIDEILSAIKQNYWIEIESPYFGSEPVPFIEEDFKKFLKEQRAKLTKMIEDAE